MRFALGLACCAILTAGDREVSGSIGYGSLWDDEGSLGRGIVGGFALGVHGDRKLGFEFDYAISRNARGENFRGRTQYLLANGLMHFARGKAQPYFLFGGGLAVHTNVGAQRFLSRTPTGAGPALAIGFGVKGFINEHWFIRPEVRITSGFGGSLHEAIEPPATVPRVSIGAGYRW